jgi:hypothetical protein
MAEIADQPGVESSGGFRIGVSRDELTVAADPSSMPRRLIAWVLAMMLVVALGTELILSGGSLTGLLVALFIAAVLGIPYLLTTDRNLRCTRAAIEVIRVRRGHVVQTVAYQRLDIGPIQYGAVSYSRSGAIYGLMFRAAGKRIKSLNGLKPVEAQRILRELERLGYEVQHDAGMATRVEREMARRNSPFRSLWN